MQSALHRLAVFQPVVSIRLSVGDKAAKHPCGAGERRSGLAYFQSF
ncbi:hypothetical protein DES47_106156 [Roseateles toxinivorans]|uniref:Uncharacterized protein n=1 Tax=Roseateles toxinivorans TaxID=270368 RepID=A0A4R6QI27_9BURK|nr:hypothetical protein DES47_106156 [Roseateles toxinivorans]